MTGSPGAGKTTLLKRVVADYYPAGVEQSLGVTPSLSTTQLVVERVPSAALTSTLTSAIHSLCDAAYDTPTAPLFESLGPGEHLLGFQGTVLVSHLMWVTRWLQPAGARALKTSYVEMVATAPGSQRRGYASALLEKFVSCAGDYDLAALCPATEGLYARLGWRFWQGPLYARKDGRLLATPEERVMILILPRTPLLDLDAPLSVEWRPGEVW
jgi:aminoglycoside 2'-N-acetyltransferase I